MRQLAFVILLFLICLIPSDRASATYGEECLSEGCNAEEVRELYSSYNEECIHEGCSHEEVIELAGHPSNVDAMLAEFRRRGFEVLPGSSPGTSCTATGSRTRCTGILNWCQDWYFCPGGTDACPPDDLFCPGGNTKSAWYVCGICFGFKW